MCVTEPRCVSIMNAINPLQRVTVHQYNGRPDGHGTSGRLRIFKVCQAETVMQPEDTLYESALLSSGHAIPRVGLGTWKSEKGQVKHAVYEALKAGYRHVDCAAIYEN